MGFAKVIALPIKKEYMLMGNNRMKGLSEAALAQGSPVRKTGLWFDLLGKVGRIIGVSVGKTVSQDKMIVKQKSIEAEHPCPWHGENEEGKFYDSKSILPQDICPWLYHTLYPYFLGLLYGAKFTYNELGDCHVCCPAAKGIDLVVKKRDNDGNIHPDVSKDWDFVIFADVVKVHEDCPANHKVGDRFIFPTVMKEEFMCTAAFNHVFPLLDLERPECLDKKAIRCPDWINPVFFDIDNK